MSEYRLFETTIDELDYLCGNDIDACDLEIDSPTLYGHGVATIQTSSESNATRLCLYNDSIDTFFSEQCFCVFACVVSLQDNFSSSETCSNVRLHIPLLESQLTSSYTCVLSYDMVASPVASYVQSSELCPYVRLRYQDGLNSDITSSSSISVACEFVDSMEASIQSSDSCEDTRLHIPLLSTDSFFQCVPINIAHVKHIKPETIGEFSEADSLIRVYGVDIVDLTAFNEEEYITRIYGLSFNGSTSFSEWDWITRAFSIHPETGIISGKDELSYILKGWGWIRFVDSQIKGGIFR